MSDVKETVSKMTNALVRANSYQYATGYLQSLLTEVIEKHVTDQTEIEMLKIRMLDIGINQLLKSTKDV